MMRLATMDFVIEAVAFFSFCRGYDRTKMILLGKKINSGTVYK